jgi:NAD-dependent deacetylase
VSALTGAGVSTDSGIPDFRGPQGVWTRDPAAQALSRIEHYVADPGLRRRAWRNRLGHPAWTARPNAAHLALRDLERAGRLRAVVTQNIDGLHQRAGSSPERVIELHARVEAGEEDPACPDCGGIMKSATISFGQRLRAEVLAAAVAAARDCDLFIAAGSSLTVQPAAGLCAEAAGNGARLVVANAQPTPYDEMADLVIREPLSEALPRLARQIIDAG